MIARIERSREVREWASSYPPRPLGRRSWRKFGNGRAWLSSWAVVRPPCLTTFKSPCQTPIPDLSNIYCQSPPQLLPRSSYFPAAEFPFDANPSLVYVLCCSNCTIHCLLLLRNPHFPQDSAAPNQQQQSIARENKSQRFNHHHPLLKTEKHERKKWTQDSSTPTTQLVTENKWPKKKKKMMMVMKVFGSAVAEKEQKTSQES